MDLELDVDGVQALLQDALRASVERRGDALCADLGNGDFVEGPSQSRIEEILDVLRADDVLAWELNAIGDWQKVPTTTGVDSHETMANMALERRENASA